MSKTKPTSGFGLFVEDAHATRPLSGGSLFAGSAGNVTINQDVTTSSTASGALKKAITETAKSAISSAAASLIKKAGRALSAAADAVVATLAKQAVYVVLQTLSATASSSMSIARSVARAISTTAGSSLSIAARLFLNMALSATAEATGALARALRKAAAATAGSSPSLTRLVGATLNAISQGYAALLRGIGKSLSVVASQGIAGLARLMSEPLSAIGSHAASVIELRAIIRAATASVSGSISSLVGRTIAAAAGSLPLIGRNLVQIAETAAASTQVIAIIVRASIVAIASSTAIASLGELFIKALWITRPGFNLLSRILNFISGAETTSFELRTPVYGAQVIDGEGFVQDSHQR
jgi:hypothetical protein